MKYSTKPHEIEAVQIGFGSFQYPDWFNTLVKAGILEWIGENLLSMTVGETTQIARTGDYIILDGDKVKFCEEENFNSELYKPVYEMGWKQRLWWEHKEICDKIAKLELYIEDNKITDTDILYIQLDAMKTYARILFRRVEWNEQPYKGRKQRDNNKNQVPRR